ncbi:hypothetical protein, partial [Leptospira noumeaensis]|uniref:hypothetical protein n=1 Tax=Leptospira noumeaensis TaxID=2484964 RepID=UPI00142DF374
AVIDSIKGMLDSFQTDLDTGVTCNLDGGCTYHQKGGALNSAGTLLKNFLDQMRPKVENVALDPSLFFSDISSSFSTFLQSQKDIANSKYEFHESNILTYQSNAGINYETYRDYTQTDINSLVSSILYQHYGAGSAIYSTDSWLYEGHGGGAVYNIDAHFATFNTISDPNLRSLYEKIYSGLVYNNGDLSGVKSALQGILGSNYEVTNVLAANIYTDWQNGANKSDPWAYVSLLKSQGNLYNDKNRFAMWVVDQVVPPFVYWHQYYQMGGLQMGLLYEVKDKNQEALATHWNGTTSSLGNQLSLF